MDVNAAERSMLSAKTPNARTSYTVSGNILVPTVRVLPPPTVMVVPLSVMGELPRAFGLVAAGIAPVVNPAITPPAGNWGKALAVAPLAPYPRIVPVPVPLEDVMTTRT